MRKLSYYLCLLACGLFLYSCSTNTNLTRSAPEFDVASSYALQSDGNSETLNTTTVTKKGVGAINNEVSVAVIEQREKSIAVQSKKAAKQANARAIEEPVGLTASTGHVAPVPEALMPLALEYAKENMSLWQRIKLRFAEKVGRMLPSGGKSQLVALLLCIFAGGLGVHRFYLGYIGIGVAQLLTGGGCGIWALVDLIRIITGSLEPKDGRYSKTL